VKRVFLELGGKSAKIVLDDVPNFAQEIASSILVFSRWAGLRGPIAAAGCPASVMQKRWKFCARLQSPRGQVGCF